MNKRSFPDAKLLHNQGIMAKPIIALHVGMGCGNPQCPSLVQEMATSQQNAQGSRIAPRHDALILPN